MANQKTAQIRKLDRIYPYWRASTGSDVKDILSFRANVVIDGKFQRGYTLVPASEGGAVKNPSRGVITRMIAEAEAALAQLDRLHAAPRKGKVFAGTWLEAANKYLAECHGYRALKGRPQVYNLIDRHVRRGPFADWELTREDFPRALAEYCRPYENPGYKAKVFSAFDRIAKWLVEEEHHNHVMTQQKVCRVTFPNPRKNAKREPKLTEAETHAILTHMRPQHRDFVEFLLYSGWRPKAVRNLRKQDLQLHLRVPVAARLVKAAGPDTRKDVPLHPHLIPMLKRKLQEHPESEWVFPNADGSKRSDKASIMSQYIREALEKGGVKTHRHIRQYSLRHSAGAAYKDAGVETATAVELLDHSVEIYIARYGMVSTQAGQAALVSALDYGAPSTAPDSVYRETAGSAAELRQTFNNHPLTGGMRACGNPSESMGLASAEAACCAASMSQV